MFLPLGGGKIGSLSPRLGTSRTTVNKNADFGIGFMRLRNAPDTRARQRKSPVGAGLPQDCDVVI